MKKSIYILILFSLLIFPSCKKNQSKLMRIVNTNIILDTTNIRNKEYRNFMRKLVKEELDGFLKDSTNNLLRGEVLINDEKELIQLVEPILFKIYGENKIIQERPYDAYLFGDYWMLTGTLPEGMKGGTFNIAINRRTCEVVGISHGK
jgi:hypothetical protein